MYSSVLCLKEIFDLTYSVELEQVITNQFCEYAVNEQEPRR